MPPLPPQPATAGGPGLVGTAYLPLRFCSLMPLAVPCTPSAFLRDPGSPSPPRMSQAGGGACFPLG